MICAQDHRAKLASLSRDEMEMIPAVCSTGVLRALSSGVLEERILEHRVGIEPTNTGFAEPKSQAFSVI
jgi:hypothetical protein